MGQAGTLSGTCANAIPWMDVATWHGAWQDLSSCNTFPSQLSGWSPRLMYRLVLNVHSTAFSALSQPSIAHIALCLIMKISFPITHSTASWLFPFRPQLPPGNLFLFSFESLRNCPESLRISMDCNGLCGERTRANYVAKGAARCAMTCSLRTSRVKSKEMTK